MTNSGDTTLIIRTDANIEIGNGHVMRCLALAQAWQDTGGKVIFSMATQSPSIEARLKKERIALVNMAAMPGSLDDARRVIELARLVNTFVVVVDGYHFDAKYQSRIKEAGLFLIFIDDYGHADYYWADLVLNQNIYAHEGLYDERAPYTKLFLGAQFVLIRREFLNWKEWERDIQNEARKVLVTLGGSDPQNASLQVIQALEQVPLQNLEAVVVIGASNPHVDSLERAIVKSRCILHLETEVMNMPELMAWADVAVSAAGGTSWELAFMGLPSVMLVLSDNQEPVAKALDSAGVVRNLGRLRLVETQSMAEAVQNLLEDLHARKRMSRELRKIVDGRGASRVVSAMRSIV